jgi:hypothetical protein
LGQFDAELGDDDVHTSFASRIPQQGRNASNSVELNISTRTRYIYDLLLLAITNQIEKGVDNVDVADQVCFDLCTVNFYCCRSSASRRIIRSH